MAAETPAAPLEKAVREAEAAIESHSHLWPKGSTCQHCSALRSLLAALDADRGEAEAALREIADSGAPCWFTDDCPDTDEPCGTCGLKRIARRYFARREGVAVRGDAANGEGR